MPHTTNNQNLEQDKSISFLEKALIASEIRYRRLFESAKDGILILDAQTGKIIDVNPFLIKLLSYSKESFIEKSIWEIGFFKDIIENKEKFIELQRNNYVRYEDLPLETADGYKINVEFVSNVYLEGRQKVIQCNIRDITERKKLKMNLSTAVEIAKLGYWEFDVKSGNFTFDDQYYRLIHGSSTEKQGGNLMNAEEFARKLVHPDDSKMIEANLQEAISSSDPEYLGRAEARVFRDNGDFTNVMVQFKAVKNDTGQTVKVFGINQDVIEQKRFEQELILAKEKAEESDYLKSSFLANMSHEVRTPLNSIIGFSELLSDAEFKEDQKDGFIKHIITSGNNLLKIISDIMDISKLESGELKIHNKRIYVHDFISNVEDQFALLAIEKKLELTLIHPPNSKETAVIADSDRLRQIFNNLMSNAIKFTSNGKIEIGYQPLGKKIEFYVRDTGIGIPKEYQEKIFERFRQVEDKTNRKFGGNGLGLSISKNLVELMGGNIRLVSAPGVGSAFYFTLPALFQPE